MKIYNDQNNCGITFCMMILPHIKDLNTKKQINRQQYDLLFSIYYFFD
jgi:hypothetical protein